MRTWQYIKILVCTFVILLCNNIVFAQGEYGYIDVVTSTSSSGALMYVDGNFMSTVPALVRISEGKHIFSFQKDGYISYEQECIIKADRTLCMSINLHGSGKDVTLKTVKYAEIWIDGNYVSKGEWKGFLQYGQHRIESRAPRCEPTILELDYSELSDVYYILQAPSISMGSLSINSSAIGAKVRLDGIVVGNTPLVLKDALTLGTHYVEVEFHDSIIGGEVIVAKDEIVEFVANFPHYELVNIRTTPNNTSVKINGDTFGYTPYETYLKEGSYSLSLNADNYIGITTNIDVYKDNGTFVFNLIRQYIKASCFYVTTEYQFLNMSGIKGSIGGFINNVNIEANVVYSPTSSETIYWSHPEEMTTPYGYQYKPIYCGARFGYGLTYGTRLRITPQLGGGVVSIKGKVVEEGENNPMTTDGYGVVGVIGLRTEFAIAPSISLVATPQYSMPLVKSKLYSQVANVSRIIQGYTLGFNASMGVCFFF